MAIKVFGVGNGGIAALGHLFHEKPADTELVAVDTNFQVLISPQADLHIWIGGGGTKGNPAVGQQAAKASIGQIRPLLDTTTCLYLVSAFGGGTGTGATPLIASYARSRKIPTIAIIARPFSFEPHYRSTLADAGIRRLKPYVDDIAIIESDQWLSLMPKKAISPQKAFALQARALAWNTLAFF